MLLSDFEAASERNAHEATFILNRRLTCERDDVERIRRERTVLRSLSRHLN